MRSQSRCQTLPKAPLSWEQPLEFVNCLRLKGWQVPRGKETTKSSEGSWGRTGDPALPGLRVRQPMWELRNPARSAAAKQLPGAQPQKQKNVHMVSICLRGETLILSCHPLVAKPELPRPARLALP